MSYTSNQRLMGELFRKSAQAESLIFEQDRRPGPGEIVFNFYINSNGDMLTVSDPIKLAQLILLGHQFEPEHVIGDHRILLYSYATISEIENPTSYGEDRPKYVQWDYEHETTRPNIRFQDWLVKELYSKQLTFEEKKVRHDLMMLLAQFDESPLNLVERWLWWL